MTDKEKKEKLLNFLDRKAFDPIINKEKDDYKSQEKKKKFEHVKQSTKSEKERFREYDSAEEVRDNYLSDLNSQTAKKINKELDDLNLPKLPDFEDEFLELCDRMGLKK